LNSSQRPVGRRRQDAQARAKLFAPLSEDTDSGKGLPANPCRKVKNYAACAFAPEN
jgi:hypothetical protein